MYEIIKQAIKNGGYKLTAMQTKIKRMYILGDLDDEQLNELLTLASAGAEASAERPETLAMLKELDTRVRAIEVKLSTEGESSGEATSYPVWTTWNGVSDNYQPGAVVSHNGKLWQSTYTGQNVWEPGVVDDSFWVEYREEA